MIWRVLTQRPPPPVYYRVLIWALQGASMKRAAVTLVEVLVVIAIIGLLAALLLPAIQSARESSRRTKCATNVRQMALALHAYADTHSVLPASARSGNLSFHVTLLPHLEQEALYGQFDSLAVNALEYDGSLFDVRVSTYECPSDGSGFGGRGQGARTNYHGNSGTGVQQYGFNGLFLFGYSTDRPPGSISHLPLSAITDGLSQTAMLGEIATGDGSLDPRRCVWQFDTAALELQPFAGACRDAPGSATAMLGMTRGRPWPKVSYFWSVYNHVLPPNSPSCCAAMAVRNSLFTAGSMHPSVVNTGFADGSVQITIESIDELACASSARVQAIHSPFQFQWRSAMFRSLQSGAFVATFLVLALCPALLADWSIGEPAGTWGDPTIKNTPQGSFGSQGEGPGDTTWEYFFQFKRTSGSDFDPYGYTRETSSNPVSQIQTNSIGMWMTTCYPDPLDENYPVGDYYVTISGVAGPDPLRRFNVRNP